MRRMEAAAHRKGSVLGSPKDTERPSAAQPSPRSTFSKHQAIHPGPSGDPVSCSPTSCGSPLPYNTLSGFKARPVSSVPTSPQCLCLHTPRCLTLPRRHVLLSSILWPQTHQSSSQTHCVLNLSLPLHCSRLGPVSVSPKGAKPQLVGLHTWPEASVLPPHALSVEMQGPAA